MVLFFLPDVDDTEMGEEEGGEAGGEEQEKEDTEGVEGEDMLLGSALAAKKKTQSSASMDAKRINVRGQLLSMCRVVTSSCFIETVHFFIYKVWLIDEKILFISTIYFCPNIHFTNFLKINSYRSLARSSPTNLLPPARS